MKQLIEKDNVELVVVHPRDYNNEKGTIKRGYRFVNSSRIEEILKEHKPEGDMFIIFGDETSKNIGLDFAKKQYDFLDNLKKNKNFRYFFNNPDAEKSTLKSYLIEISKDASFGVARTYSFENRDSISRLLDQYGTIIMKPIFGCRGAGVRKLSSIEDIFKIPDDVLKADYIFQEPLEGDEKRVVILDNEFLCARIHKNRKTPWNQNNNQETFRYVPTSNELEIARKLGVQINADIIGVDFIGDKVNEINGTGTGLKIIDHNGNLLYDHSIDLSLIHISEPTRPY